VPLVLIPALVFGGLAVGVPLGIYGRWAGWGFGLGWWGRPTPARVLEVTPLTGAVLTGHSEQTLVEQSHRVALRLEVQADPPYETTTIGWQPAGDHLGGRTVVARVSRTRPTRVHVPRNAPEAPEADGTY
jgi:hypothetical protein